MGVLRDLGGASTPVLHTDVAASNRSQLSQKTGLASEVSASAPRIGTKLRPRSTLIDAARGFAIVLVVVGHVSQGMQNRGLWHGSVLAYRLDAWMYSFHMPAFFFMAGLFVLESIQKRGTLTFLRDRASALLWPYMLFELANMSIYRLNNHMAHTPAANLQDAAWVFLTAASAWFLPTLFFSLLVFAMIRRLPMPLLLAASLVVRAYCLRIPVNFAAAGLYFLPFVLLGAIVGSSVEWVRRVPPWLAAGLVSALGWAIWRATGLGWQWKYAGALLLALAGTLMLVLTARLLERTPLVRGAAWCGQASLGIFLLAPYPQVVVRSVLLRFHQTGAVLQLTLPSLIAIVVSAWIYHRRQNLHLQWLFHFGGGRNG